jgi:DnaJ-class molecular chaperone
MDTAERLMQSWGMEKPPKLAEHKCPECNGTGFPVVPQPARPDRKIYPVRCTNCDGKGRIAGAAN